jgi:uncharacterized membrane protein
MLDILKGVFALVLAVSCFVAWRQHSNKDYFWLGVIGSALVLIKVWDLLNGSVLHLSVGTGLIVNIVILLLSVAMFVLVLKIAFVGSRKRVSNDVRDGSDKLSK